MNVATPYIEFARKAFARSATYRFEVFTDVGSFLLRIYLLRSLWTALYAQNAAPSNLPFHAIITYSAVALLMSLILEVDGTRQIQTRVREGSIATDLMKPISLPLFFFSDGFGETAFHALTIVPSLALALLLVRVDVPSFTTLVAFAVAFALGYFVNFLINFLMNAVAFWTLETQAIQMSVRWASDLLSGQLLPLSLFPGVFGQIVQNTPFAAIYSVPLQIYVGQIQPAGYATAFATQIGWLVLFAILAVVVWRSAERRVVVQGG
jgi:ABC-2 type transport system permease protein